MSVLAACFLSNMCGCVMQIGIEDFRVMTESFGMQLDDDSLLALFSRVSPFCSTREHTLHTVLTERH